MDFSWSEMMLVGIVALIVIGPKDLPGMFRELGRITARIRSMGREFSRAMEQAAKESGVKEATDGLKTLTNPVGTGLGAMKSAADKFEKWDPIKNAAKPTQPLTPPPMPASVPMAPVAEGAPAAAPDVGPATAALYEQKAARKAVIDEAAGKLKAISAAPAPAKKRASAASKTASAAPVVTEPTPSKPGRVRKKADKAAGDAG